MDTCKLGIINYVNEVTIQDMHHTFMGAISYNNAQAESYKQT